MPNYCSICTGRNQILDFNHIRSFAHMTNLRKLPDGGAWCTWSDAEIYKYIHSRKREPAQSDFL